MSWMKLLTSPILIATLTSSVLVSFTSIADAKPVFRPVTPNTQLSGNYNITGNILKEDPTVGNIFCERITVTLIEFIPNEPQSGQLNVPTQQSVGQAVTATGNHLGEGCSYSLGFRYLPKIRTNGASTFKIRASAIDEIAGEQSVSYPFPNNIDIPLFPPPPAPR
jgi:hypothetical protein